jgi:hypothetical protein
MFSKEVLIMLLAAAPLGCQQGDSGQSKAVVDVHETTRTVSNPASKTPTSETSGIRQIDFKNFTYTGPADYRETFTLIDGKKERVSAKEDGYFLEETKYFDLTGDGRDEAVIIISVHTGGSATPALAFVYTLDKDKPRLLWRFISGDRAKGGLKDIYPENADLVIELFGDAKYLNGSWSSTVPVENSKGDCCPINYTKTVFRWDRRQFVVSGKPQIFDLDSNSAR